MANKSTAGGNNNILFSFSFEAISREIIFTYYNLSQLFLTNSCHSIIYIICMIIA